MPVWAIVAFRISLLRLDGDRAGAGESSVILLGLSSSPTLYRSPLLTDRADVLPERLEGCSGEVVTVPNELRLPVRLRFEGGLGAVNAVRYSESLKSRSPNSSISSESVQKPENRLLKRRGGIMGARWLERRRSSSKLCKSWSSIAILMGEEGSSVLYRLLSNRRGFRGGKLPGRGMSPLSGTAIPDV
jgi:hypothetical protein